eukprot:1685289-Rhodomonas_salina.2
MSDQDCGNPPEAMRYMDDAPTSRSLIAEARGNIGCPVHTIRCVSTGHRRTFAQHHTLCQYRAWYSTIRCYRASPSTIRYDCTARRIAGGQHHTLCQFRTAGSERVGG